jgi:hypothetical protein
MSELGWVGSMGWERYGSVSDATFYNFSHTSPDMLPGMSQISPGLLPLFTGETGKNREKCGRNPGSVCHEV